jgi:hypothetical protein
VVQSKSQDCHYYSRITRQHRPRLGRGGKTRWEYSRPIIKHIPPRRRRNITRKVRLQRPINIESSATRHPVPAVLMRERCRIRTGRRTCVRLCDAGGVGLICELKRDSFTGVGGESCVGGGGGVGDVLDVGFLGVGVVEEHSWWWQTCVSRDASANWQTLPTGKTAQVLPRRQAPSIDYVADGATTEDRSHTR